LFMCMAAVSDVVRVSLLRVAAAGRSMMRMTSLGDDYEYNLNPPTPVPGRPCDCDSVFNQFDDAYKCSTCP
jgi:hypothetical protein